MPTPTTRQTVVGATVALAAALAAWGTYRTNAPSTPPTPVAAPVAADSLADVGPPMLGDLPVHRIMRRVDNWWNTPIDTAKVDPRSLAWTSHCGWNGFSASPNAGAPLHADFGTTYRGVPDGIPYNVVTATTPRTTFQPSGESDNVPYPWDSTSKIENGPYYRDTGNDHHAEMVSADTIWELYQPHTDTAGAYAGKHYAASGAVWSRNTNGVRADGWTSADAAGMQILPGLVRYDEVASGQITHALRGTCQHMRNTYYWPARHQAGWSAYGPPEGVRFRLKASVDTANFAPNLRPIIQALKVYGMYMDDIGGPFFLSGSPDPRWSDAELHDQFGKLHEVDFEAVVPVVAKEEGTASTIKGDTVGQLSYRQWFVADSTAKARAKADSIAKAIGAKATPVPTPTPAKP